MKRTITLILLASLAVLAVSAGVMLQNDTQDRSAAQAFASLSDQFQALVTAKAEGKAEAAPLVQGPVTITGEPVWPQTDDPTVLALREKAMENPDLVGWLTIDGTVIDYPVMRTPQEAEKYLHLDYDGSYSRAGTPFMLPISDPSVPNNNNIIYAHHMKDGSMFGSLPAYEKKAAFDAQPYIQFDTIYARGTYKIVAVFRTSIGAEDEFPYYRYEWLEDAETFDRYMRGVMANRLYDTGETAEYGDMLISLSTCDYHEPNGRLVVVAKLVDETEANDHV